MQQMSPYEIKTYHRYSYPTGWSNSRQQLVLDDFVLAAEKEVTRT
jgi:hypothetical protein